jgi:hypothetical protein
MELFLWYRRDGRNSGQNSKQGRVESLERETGLKEHSQALPLAFGVVVIDFVEILFTDAGAVLVVVFVLHHGELRLWLPFPEIAHVLVNGVVPYFIAWGPVFDETMILLHLVID